MCKGDKEYIALLLDEDKSEEASVSYQLRKGIHEVIKEHLGNPAVCMLIYFILFTGIKLRSSTVWLFDMFLHIQ